MATPNEQLSAALRSLDEKADQLCRDVGELLTEVATLSRTRNLAADSVSKDHPFSSVVRNLRDLSAAVDTCSSAHSKATAALLKVEEQARRLREVVNG